MRRWRAGGLLAPALLLAAGSSLPACRPAGGPRAEPGAPAIASRSASAANLPPAAAASLPAAMEARPPQPVEDVVDGDTLVLRGGERVRVLGIDTPEMRGGRPLARRLAHDAREELLRLLAGGPVVVVGRPGQVDIYGRTLAYLHAPRADGSPGEDLGARLIRTGFAHVYPSEHPRLAPYLQLQDEARAAARGVWSPEGLQALDFGYELEIDAARAGDHVGRRARVVGRVFDLHRSEGALFVNLGPDWRKDFTAVVLKSDWPLFPADAETLWRGRVLAVTGRIERRNGRPQVLLRDPAQLELLER